MVRIPPFQGGSPGSIPGVGIGMWVPLKTANMCMSIICGVLAQVVERALSMCEVGGSMPPYSNSLIAQLVRACDC